MQDSSPEPEPSSSSSSEQPEPTSPSTICPTSESGTSWEQLPSWDSGPLPPSQCSLDLGSYSPETAAELAALRVTASYGLGLLVFLTAAGTVARWRR